jgi:uncharacterized Zn finger protein
MSFEITCEECGERVPFPIAEDASAPLTETCSECGSVWRVEIRQIV